LTLRKEGTLTGVVVGLALGLMLASVVAEPEQDSIAERFGLPKEWDKAFFEPLGAALDKIEAEYVEDVDPSKALVGAYQGLLSTLDEHSLYIPPERLEEFQGDTRGEFGGLGIQIRFLPQEKALRVEQPIPGTPAFREGVLTGDFIIRVREESTGEVMETKDFEDIHEAVRVLRGAPGTKVTITVVHEDSRAEEDITIERAIIKIPGVREAHMVDEARGIGYVYVPQFHEGTVRDLKRAIANLQRQGLEALILDLRFNGGGLLSSAIEVSDLFLERSVIVSTRGRDNRGFLVRSRTADILAGAPLAVLVNRHSASGSEIVAGAIKDNGRGLVIGETTYGKASVQTIIPLDGDHGALKLTTAKYYTPSGVCIHGTGVEPDVKIPLTLEEMRGLASKISQYSEYPSEREEEPQETPLAPGAPESEGEQEVPFRDVQLERAVDILTGMLIERERSVAAEEVEVGAR